MTQSRSHKVAKEKLGWWCFHSWAKRAFREEAVAWRRMLHSQGKKTEKNHHWIW